MRKISLISILTVTLVGTMDTQAIVPMISLYATELGATLALSGLIVGVYSIVHIPSNILFGRVVDKVGRKTPLTVGLMSDAVSVLLYSISKNPVQLLLARIAHGVGGGLIGPASMALVTDAASPPSRGRVMALYGISISVSVLAGFMMSGIVTERLGYKPLFYIISGTLAVAALITRFISEPKRISIKSSLSNDFRKVVELFKRKKLLTSYTAIFSVYFTLGTITALFPLYVREYGMTAFHVAMLFAAYVMLSILVHYPSGVISDKVGRRPPAALGLGLTSMAVFAIPFFRTFESLILVMVMYGAGHGLIFPTASALVADGTMEAERGIATGIFYALLVAGVAVGAPIISVATSALGLEQGLRASSIVPMTALLAILLKSGGRRT